MTKLEELRARLKEQQEKSNFKPDFSGGSPVYQHWNIKEGKDKEGNENYASIRFLPDGNNDSSFFWVEKATIKLPFAGVKGKSTAPIKVTVPCMQMYGETCPITEEIKPLWKSDEETARIYYKKRSYLFHGFVRKDGVGEETTPENHIRRFSMNTELYKLIHAGLMDPDMENLPTDYSNGTDFNIYKTKKGQWADYTTSRWSRKSGSLTEAEALAVDKFGLPDLTTYLPKKPTETELQIIMDMFVDSMNGDAYDLEKYGNYFKPFGVDDNAVQKGSGTYATTTTAVSEEAEEVETVQPTVVTKPSVTTGSGDKPKTSVQDLLNQINKSKKQA